MMDNVEKLNNYITEYVHLTAFLYVTCAIVSRGPHADYASLL
jgi:hypothetical protein